MNLSIEQTIDSFFTSHELVSFEKDIDLLHHDENLEFVYQIKSGVVKEFMMSEQGVELTLGLYSKQDIIPLVLNTATILRSSCFKTHSQCELYRVSHGEYQAFLLSNQEVFEKISHQIGQKYSLISRKLGCLMFCHARIRVIDSILFLAKKFGASHKGVVTLTIVFTHKDIAALAGVTRETASAEISRLAHQQLIATSGRQLVIPAVDRLMAELDQFREKK